MARTQHDQLMLRITNNPEQHSLHAAGDDWVNSDLVATFLARQLGRYSFQRERVGSEPWSESERDEFYGLFDALPQRYRDQLTRSSARLGEQMPERTRSRTATA